MQSLDDKLFYLRSISKDLNTQLLTLIALRESTNEAHRRIAYRGRRRRRRRARKREFNGNLPFLLFAELSRVGRRSLLELLNRPTSLLRSEPSANQVELDAPPVGPRWSQRMTDQALS